MHMNTGLSTLPIIIIGAACSMPATAEPEAPGTCVIWEHAKDLLPSVPSLKAWELAAGTTPWEGRRAPGSTVLGNMMWFYGGRSDEDTPEDEYFNDVWSTQNGSTWTRAIEHAAWSPRFAFGAAAYKGKLWAMGGGSGGAPLNDVYSSPDGINWTEATASAQWSGRTYFATVVHDNLLWVLGGASAPGGVFTLMNDVWYSADGATWTRAPANADWPGRTRLKVVSFDGKIWVVGGYDGDTRYRDVWFSVNGNTWTLATATAAWGAKISQSVAAYDGRLWLTGGYPGPKDVWYSDDGASWFEGEKPAWDGRGEHISHAFNNKLYLFGGTTEDGNYPNQIWAYESASGVGCGGGAHGRAGSPIGDLLALVIALLFLAATGKTVSATTSSTMYRA